MKQKIITSILILCICLPLMGQHHHEFSINVGGGLSSLNFKPSVGKSTSGFGGEAGIGYHFFFSPKWSVGTGLNLALYNSKASFGTYNRITDALTLKNTNFKFSYSMSNYKEEISAMILTIPLMLQFQTPGKIGFYVAGGGKIGLPLNANYKTSIGSLTTDGAFPWDVTYDDLPQYAFGNYQGVNQKTDMKLNPAFMLSGEAGVKWSLGSMYLYTGAYIDYGLNDVRKDKPASLLAYDKQARSYPSGFVYNGMANSLSNKVAPLAIGVKLRLYLGSLFFKKAEKVEKVEKIE
ncbi:MAG: PorT family protein [Prevotellaceae bacterium]|nr:PorT family protein [Prevotellaceae bacterium]